MYLALGMLIFGILAGRILRSALQKLPLAKILFLFVLLLLFLLGLQIGSNEQIFAQLHRLGAQAGALTLSAVAGTILAALPLQRFLRRHLPHA